MENKIHLKITSNNGILLDEYVNYVHLPLTDGGYGILSNHTPLIGALKSGQLQYRIDNKDYFTEIGDGVVSVFNNVVEILIRSNEEH